MGTLRTLGMLGRRASHRKRKLAAWTVLLTVVCFLLLETILRAGRSGSSHHLKQTVRTESGLGSSVTKAGLQGAVKPGRLDDPPVLASPRRWSHTTPGALRHRAAVPLQSRQPGGASSREHEWRKTAFMTKAPPGELFSMWQHVANRNRKGHSSLRNHLPPKVFTDVGDSDDVDLTSRDGEHGLGFHHFRKLHNRKLDFQQMPVSRSAQPTFGHPWPFPQFYHYNQTVSHVLDMRTTQFTVGVNTCEVLEKALQRQKRYYLDLIKRRRDSGSKEPVPGMSVLRNVKVIVRHKCDAYPQLDSDESYELYINDNTLFLRAPEVWGILLGIQTLSQLVVASRGQLTLRHIRISDFPRFKHRGIMLDTARHYLSKQVLLTNLDAMMANKLNVFHWHLVDDQSFPYQSVAFPQMTEKGAYSPTSVYTEADIKEVVEYARLRGIRVIPELDTPGHVQSWLGLPEVLTPCDGPTNYGPIDPTRTATYEKLPELLGEVLRLFPAATLHMGGDECSYYCWAHNANINKFMKSHHMSGDFKALFSYYFTRLQKVMAEKLGDKLRTSIYWQEVFDEQVKLTNQSIVHLWKDDYTGKLAEVTQAGHRVLLSSCWYLNYVSYGSDWHKYYTCDPHQFNGTPEQKALVLGGEACMWGEYVDETNLLVELWPRAAAVAERLWSPQSRYSPFLAEDRFEENRCRLTRNGIPARPIGGPGPPCKDFWDT